MGQVTGPVWGPRPWSHRREVRQCRAVRQDGRQSVSTQRPLACQVLCLDLARPVRTGRHEHPGSVRTHGCVTKHDKSRVWSPEVHIEAATETGPWCFRPQPGTETPEEKTYLISLPTRTRGPLGRTHDRGVGPWLRRKSGPHVWGSLKAPPNMSARRGCPVPMGTGVSQVGIYRGGVPRRTPNMWSHLWSTKSVSTRHFFEVLARTSKSEKTQVFHFFQDSVGTPRNPGKPVFPLRKRSHGYLPRGPFSYLAGPFSTLHIGVENWSWRT